jgi:Fe-S-cluster containining protein
MIIKPVEPEYRKVGECNRCGACCRMIPLWKSLNDAERALLRMNDPESENVLNKAMDSGCSNLTLMALFPV